MEDRELKWIDALKNKLIEVASSDIYHLAYCIKDHNNRTLYYLVYFTKKIKGIEVMKDAMFKTGKTGLYRFSDYDFKQKSLLDYSTDLWRNECVKQVHEKFQGSVAKVEDIKNWVILETPFIWRKEILKILEKDGKIECLSERSKCFTYPEKAIIKFRE